MWTKVNFRRSKSSKMSNNKYTKVNNWCSKIKSTKILKNNLAQMSHKSLIQTPNFYLRKPKIHKEINVYNITQLYSPDNKGTKKSKKNGIKTKKKKENVVQKEEIEDMENLCKDITRQVEEGA